MTKLLATICIFVTLFALCSADCSATAGLRAIYGLSNSLASPQTYSGLKYCKSIKSGPVCCTDTQINSFQDMAYNYTANLSAMAATRDTYIKNVQENVIPLMQQSLQAIQSQASQIASIYSSAAFSDLSNSTDLGDAFGMIANASEILTLISGNVEDEYTSYQKSRQTCVLSMVKLQLAALCVSCDPNAASKGFNSLTGELSISERVCTRIENACSDYIAAAEDQNAIIEASYGAQMLQTVVAILQAVQTNNYDSLSNLENSAGEVQGPDSYLVAAAVTPPGCEEASSGTCTWICTDLFDGVAVDSAALIVGGEIFDYSSLYDTDPEDGGRLLAKADSNNRRLGSGDFDPDSDESGVTVTFAVDPSGTNSEDSFGNLSFGNVFFSMMIVLASLLVL